DDFRARHAVLRVWRTRRGRNSDADVAALAAIDQAASGWRRRFGLPNPRTPREHHPHPNPPLEGEGLTAIGDLLIHAFPDRVARQDPGNPLRYSLSNGRGARLHERSALYGEPWLVALDLRFEARDSLVLAAAPFDPALLERDFPHRFANERTVRWNREARAIEAFEERRFGALVLDRRSVPARDEDAVPALLAAVREVGLDALPWSNHARDLRARVALLREACPELGLPDLSDAALLE